MGTPNEVNWPGINSLPEFIKLNSPIYPKQDLKNVILNSERILDKDGFDLLEKLLLLDPR